MLSFLFIIQIHIDIERRIEVFQHSMFRIFLRKIGMFCRNIPINTKAVIENRDTAISLYMIEVITLVLKDGCF